MPPIRLTANVDPRLSTLLNSCEASITHLKRKSVVEDDRVNVGLALGGALGDSLVGHGRGGDGRDGGEHGEELGSEHHGDGREGVRVKGEESKGRVGGDEKTYPRERGLMYPRPPDPSLRLGARSGVLASG